MRAADSSAERAAIDARIAGQTLCTVVERNARVHGDLPALSWKQEGAWRQLDWRAYRERVAEVAMGLDALGVGRGDFVAIMVRNRPEHLIADLAAVHLGATPVSLYSTLAPEQIAYIANHCEAKVAVVEGRDFMERWEKVKGEVASLRHVVLVEDAADFSGHGWVSSWDQLVSSGREALGSGRERFDAAWRAVQPGDLATVLYTSGTTGPPKGVMTTHANALWTAAAIDRWADDPSWGPGTRYVSYLPLAHSLERLSGHYVGVWKPAWLFCCPDLTKVIEILPEVRPFSFVAVPRLWEKAQAGVMAALAAEPNERRRKLAESAVEVGRRVVRLKQAGKPVPPGLRLRRAVFDRLVYRKIRQRLGLDQCHVVFSGAAPLADDVMEFFLGIGVPLREGYGLTESTAPATLNRRDRPRVGTVGPPLPGVEVRVADDGELLLRGGNIAAGYYKDLEKTAETFDPDGWLRTGDVAQLDSDGSVRIVDRKKELLVTAGGENISPTNLENLLKAHPLIAQACVVGDRKPYPAALIVLDPETASGWAAKHGVPYEGLERFAAEQHVRSEIERAVADVNQRLARVEQIKRFTILPTEWTAETDELTPTLKLKRRVIHDKYRSQIEGLYAEPR
ncbi:MAG TPA: long-chain fatty acid--CoA ligase [Actinomycetes bacterium]|jgi:long-chain acyl-CoA synthetase|nr:long-chain fatty acid--CoA ligase [Actinomycetes bacterium]